MVHGDEHDQLLLSKRPGVAALGPGDGVGAVALKPDIPTPLERARRIESPLHGKVVSSGGESGAGAECERASALIGLEAEGGGAFGGHRGGGREGVGRSTDRRAIRRHLLLAELECHPQALEIHSAAASAAGLRTAAGRSATLDAGDRPKPESTGEGGRRLDWVGRRDCGKAGSPCTSELSPQGQDPGRPTAHPAVPHLDHPLDQRPETEKLSHCRQFASPSRPTGERMAAGKQARDLGA